MAEFSLRLVNTTLDTLLPVEMNLSDSAARSGVPCDSDQLTGSRSVCVNRPRGGYVCSRDKSSLSGRVQGPAVHGRPSMSHTQAPTLRCGDSILATFPKRSVLRQWGGVSSLIDSCCLVFFFIEKATARVDSVLC